MVLCKKSPLLEYRKKHSKREMEGSVLMIVEFKTNEVDKVEEVHSEICEDGHLYEYEKD
jgi:hypothetical protein